MRRTTEEQIEAFTAAQAGAGDRGDPGARAGATEP